MFGTIRTAGILFACAALTAHAGNPVFDGWYADPQIRLYGETYWVFPTTSARFGEQTSFDAFSSIDLKTWTKHPRILTTNEVTWAKENSACPQMHSSTAATPRRHRGRFVRQPKILSI